MAQNFSNTLQLNPLGNALNNKLNPSPLGLPIPSMGIANTTPMVNGVHSFSAPNSFTPKKPIPYSPFPTAQTPNPQTTGYSTQSSVQTGSWPTQNTPTPQQTPGVNDGLYGKIVNNLANVGTDAVTGSIKKVSDLQKDYANQIAGLEGKGLDIGYGTGASKILQDNYNNRLGALETGAQNALTAQNQQITGLTAAGGLAAPIQAPYTSQVISPITGQPIQTGNSTGTTGGSLNPLNNVQTYAQQVANGQMTIDQANSALGNNPAFTGALNQAIKTINPNFNFTQSSASSQTQGVAQQIRTAADSTNRALDTLSQGFNSLNPLQKGPIPATISLSNWIATQFGDKALTAYKTNLADARSQLIGVLNSSGGTPTGNEATAVQYLPDNMTVDQFNQNVGTTENPGIVRQLINQKVQAFSNSGLQSNQSSSSSASSGGWF